MNNVGSGTLSSPGLNFPWGGVNVRNTFKGLYSDRVAQGLKIWRAAAPLGPLRGRVIDVVAPLQGHAVAFTLIAQWEPPPFTRLTLLVLSSNAGRSSGATLG